MDPDLTGASTSGAPASPGNISLTASANFLLQKLGSQNAWYPDNMQEQPGNNQGNQELTMLEQLIHLYTAATSHDVRSPVPHLAGPPGVGKSQTIRRLAELFNVNVHVLNVSRISPLELEGVQMPDGKGDEMRLRLLHNPLWTQLKEGDIVFLDEFLRGFPEVYNGLLDIISDREVAGFKLPNVFFVAASNSVTTYDAALEDRLLHLFVADIRKDKDARKHLAELIVEETGLHPSMATGAEMDGVITTLIAPMYELLDQFKRQKRSGSTALTGMSARKVIGQIRMRYSTESAIDQLVNYNNQYCEARGYMQYYLYFVPSGRASGAQVSGNIYSAMKKLLDLPDKLTPTQLENLQLSLTLMEAKIALTELRNNDNKTGDEDVLDLD